MSVAIFRTSAGRLRKAMPRPPARRMGNTKIQKSASGSRIVSRNRTIVSCTSGDRQKTCREELSALLRALEYQGWR